MADTKAKAKPKPKTDKTDLEQAILETAESTSGGIAAGTTRILDQPSGPEIIMKPAETQAPDTVVIEQKRIELENLDGLVTNQGGEVLIYGPFEEYRVVNADFGDYAVTRGNVLGFQIRDFFNKKEQRMEKQPFPVYWKAETGKQVMGSGIDPKDYNKPGERG